MSRKAPAGRALAVLLIWVFLAFHASAADSNASETASLDFANGLYSRQMYGPAASEYEKFLHNSPNSPETASALYRYADSLYFLKKYADSEAQFRVFAAKYPADKRVPGAWLRVGSACFFQTKYSEAVKVLMPLSVRGAEAKIQSGAWFYLAKSWEAAGRPERVVESYRMVVEKFRDSEYATFAAAALGDIALKGQNLSLAAEYYRTAAEAGKPVDVAQDSSLQAAEIAYGLKDYAQAKRDYERVLSIPAGDTGESGAAHRQQVLAEALIGIFHCDLQLSDWASIISRSSSEAARIASSPDRAEILYLTALAKAEQKDSDGSVQILDQVLAMPNLDSALKEKALFKKSEQLAAKGNHATSLAEIEKIFSIQGVDAARANVEKARILKALGRKKEALAAYEAALSGKSSEATKAALYEAALLDLEEKRMESAAKRFEIFSAGYPSDPNAERAMLQVIQIKLDGGRFRQAMLDARNFLRSRRDSSYLDIAFYKFGLALARLKNFRASADAFHHVVEFDSESKLAPDARYGQAVSLEGAHRYREAVEAYETLVARHPEHALTNQAFARLSYLYIRTGQTDKVAALYEDLLFNRPSVPLDSDGVFWLLQQYMDRGEYARMNRVLDAMPARFPGKDLAHEISFFRGEAAMGLGDFPKAIEHYMKSIGLNQTGPYAAHAHLGLGLAHAALNENPLAETHLTLALRDDQDVRIAVRARFELAGILLRAQKLADAAKAYMYVAILYDDPKYTPLSLLKAGECFLAVNQPEEAQKAFSELTSRYPQSEPARKIPAQPAPASGAQS